MRSESMKKVSKKVNPLFVVTNKGKDVEQVENFWQVLINKTNLAPALEFIEELLTKMFEELLGMVGNYAMFVAVKKYFDALVFKLERLFA